MNIRLIVDYSKSNAKLHKSLEDPDSPSFAQLSAGNINRTALSSGRAGRTRQTILFGTVLRKRNTKYGKSWF